MSKELIIASVSEPALQGKLNEKWQEVKAWAADAAKFQHASLACQVMAGFSLNELREHYGSQQGKRSDLTSPNDSAKLGFQELVREKCGISDDTARNWMKMAEGVKSLWKKLPARDRLKALMSLPPSQWTEDDSKLIADATHKITDGRTQLEFMWELGCAKKPSGNPNASGKGSRKLTAEEQRLKAVELALEDSGMMGKWVSASNHSFMLTAAENDLEINAQIAVLEFALKVRRKYLAVPRAQRGEALVREIEKLVKQDSPFMA